MIKSLVKCPFPTATFTTCGANTTEEWLINTLRGVRLHLLSEDISDVLGALIKRRKTDEPTCAFQSCCVLNSRVRFCHKTFTSGIRCFKQHWRWQELFSEPGGWVEWWSGATLKLQGPDKRSLTEGWPWRTKHTLSNCLAHWAVHHIPLREWPNKQAISVPPAEQ